jgi:hypothetical protein
MQSKNTPNPSINGTQKIILDDATTRLLDIVWRELLEVCTEESMQRAKNKCNYLDIFGYLVKESYQVAKYPEAKFRSDLDELCSMIYKGEEFSKTPLYTAVLGLRRIWEGDQDYLLSKDVQLGSIKGMPLPTGQDIRDLLQVKLDTITTALVQVKQQADCKDDYKAQVKYVTGILNKEYIIDAEGQIAQKQK